MTSKVPRANPFIIYCNPAGAMSAVRISVRRADEGPEARASKSLKDSGTSRTASSEIGISSTGKRRRVIGDACRTEREVGIRNLSLLS